MNDGIERPMRKWMLNSHWGDTKSLPEPRIFTQEEYKRMMNITLTGEDLVRGYREPSTNDD